MRWYSVTGLSPRHKLHWYQYTRVEGGTVRVKFLALEHTTQWTRPRARAQTQNVWGTQRRPLVVIKNLVLSLFNPQDPLVVTFKIYYLMGNESIDWQAPVRLGCPLVSSVFVQWDWWITCGKLPGVKCTQVWRQSLQDHVLNCCMVFSGHLGSEYTSILLVEGCGQFHVAVPGGWCSVKNWCGEPKHTQKIPLLARTVQVLTQKVPKVQFYYL